MKKLLLFFTLFISTSAFAQNTDSLINLIYKEQTDSARISRFYVVYEQSEGINPLKSIEVLQQVLVLTKKNKDRVGEAIVSSELGDKFYGAGSTVLGTRLLLEALKIAEGTDNHQALGITHQNLAIFTEDPLKYNELNEKALYYSTLAGDYRFICLELLNLAYFYAGQEPQQLDSVIYYAERSYQLAVTKNIEYSKIPSLLLLSAIQQKLGNNGLALEYLRIAEHLPTTQKNNEMRTRVYAQYADFYFNNPDSAFYYAYKTMDYAKRVSIIFLMTPAHMLAYLYTDKNADSALKYTKLYHSVKDSLYSINSLQQMEAMRFVENQRQEKLETDRKQNLQLSAIAIGLVVFAIAFFLFSHSIIANPKVIKFLGILSLLIVFEFINLLIHPYLGDLTHHSPVMMLGFMVCLAALLIPIHHKLEHWITHKLIEKNNRVRLAAAKKTINELESR